jgi:hypothetical protein
MFGDGYFDHIKTRLSLKGLSKTIPSKRELFAKNACLMQAEK